MLEVYSELLMKFRDRAVTYFLHKYNFNFTIFCQVIEWLQMNYILSTVYNHYNGLAYNRISFVAVEVLWSLHLYKYAQKALDTADSHIT